MISEALEKIAENCGKLRKNCGKLIPIFWYLEKIAVNPAPLCTVPEVKDKFFKSPKRGKPPPFRSAGPV